VELGDNIFNGLSSFEIFDVKCYKGVPTGTTDL
jgi:hypothetical protein